ncbi:hypothetical protein [Microvirga terrestris]|uniref:DUF945 domain-containing protein n=1 Tax=Microvirga terrestris TaxID=2791024 RepID=A0ABS0HT54_9HYPH|nr:hypothetical protein [Microvirga terrestris]MBF9196662.1 hypothetical protein [Microvirga terrestris]
MRLRYRAGVCALALLAGSAALQLEPAVVSNLASGQDHQRVSVEAVRIPLWSAAFAQSADSFSLDNARFTWGDFTYEAKRIDFSGVTVSRNEIESLFSSTAEPLADRLMRVGAKQITSPEIKVTQKIGKETQTIFYRNVSLNDVVQGQIAKAVVGTMAVETTGAKGNLLFSYGQTTISDLNTPAFVRLYETKDDSASAPMTRIYGAFTIENMDVVDNGENVSVQIARLNGRDVMARPTKDSWGGAMSFLTEMGGKDKLSPEESTRLTTAMVDIMGAFDIGFMEAVDIRIKATAKKAASAKDRKPKDQNSPVTGRINRIAYTGSTEGQPADTRLEGLEIGDQDGRVKIGTISLTGFSFTPTLNSLKALQGKPIDELDQEALRTLIPTLGTLRLSGIDVDVPNRSGEKKTDRVNFSLKDFELTADKPLNGLPTNIRIEQRNLVITLPSNSTDDLVKQLAALGYKTLDSSFLLAATWSESANEIALKEVSVQGQDMGSLLLTGTIGNVTKDLFSADQATAAAALIGAKAKAADVVVEDKGLLGRYLAQAAKDQKTTPEALRTIYASAAPFVVSAMIGNSEQASTLGQAIGRFIAKPGKLTLNAQPKNPSGFGVMDAMMASDPKEALAKLNISAKVE